MFRPGTMPYGTDMLIEGYPLRNFAVEELRAGRGFPFWNPFSYSGIPYLETLPYPVFYPTSLLYFALPLGRAIGWGFVLHFAAAGVLAFAFARRIGVSRPGAALAGLAYMFNGYLVSHLYAGHDGRMFAMTLIPLVFFFLRAGLDARRTGPYLLMGGAVALQVFTPHVQIMYFSSLAAAAYFLVEAARLARREGPRAAVAETARFGAGFALAALVAAVQLWPTLDFLEWTIRGQEARYGFASSFALPIGELSAIIAPDLVGSLSTYWGANGFKLHTEYLGAVPLALALAGLFWGDPRRTLVWAALGGGALLFALGSATPVHRLAYEWLPMVKNLRAPAMMFAVTAFSVAALAGLGFDAAAGLGGRPRPHPRDPRALAFVAVWGLLVAAWLVSLAEPRALTELVGGGGLHVSPRVEQVRAATAELFPASFARTLAAWTAAVAVLWWSRVALLPAAGLLAVLLVADLWRVDARYLRTMEVEPAFRAGPAVQYLSAREQPFRILPTHASIRANESLLHRLPEVWGLQKFRLAWYNRLMSPYFEDRVEGPELWRILNLRYVLAREPPRGGDYERVLDGRVDVYRWPGEAPRAWVVPEARLVTDEQAMELLAHPSFDPRRVALLADSPPPAATEGARDPAGAGPAAGDDPGRVDGPATLDSPEALRENAHEDLWVHASATGLVAAPAQDAVRYLSYAPNGLEAEVTAPGPSLAVFSETYHPYWEATVDGRPAPVARAYVALRAVPVPAGTHRVRMEYRPRSFERARIATLLALAGALGWAAAGWRGLRPRSWPAPPRIR